ncbi:MAG: hypothetical protein BA861_04770 [Desulfobacterales bacterium S3730MH5]|nr:MAG: hypothetical protein BA861_04770 [Desulfobacterales bacterium S3730MH5]
MSKKLKDSRIARAGFHAERYVAGPGRQEPLHRPPDLRQSFGGGREIRPACGDLRPVAVYDQEYYFLNIN